MGLKTRLLHKLHIKEPIVWWGGNYISFEQALADCSGYDSEAITEKVKRSTLTVVDGKASYERDGCLFYDKKINYPLMTYLLSTGMEDGYLSVCDFGGALGSTFFQHISIFERIDLTWTIIEQEHFVKFGRENLQNEKLHFEYDLAEVSGCNCVLFSASLQYLPSPYEKLREVCEKGFHLIVLERMITAPVAMICKETVHEPVYEASYPCHIFRENDLKACLYEYGYRLVDTWNSLSDHEEKVNGQCVVFRCYAFRKPKKEEN